MRRCIIALQQKAVALGMRSDTATTDSKSLRHVTFLSVRFKTDEIVKKCANLIRT